MTRPQNAPQASRPRLLLGEGGGHDRGDEPAGRPETIAKPDPACGVRAPTPEEFQALYAVMPADSFAVLLRVLWGDRRARPHEIRNLRWEQVREDRWVLAKDKTVKKTGKERVIYPPGGSAQRDGRGSEGVTSRKYVFLNTKGPAVGRMNAVRLQLTSGCGGRIWDWPKTCARTFAGTASAHEPIMSGVNPATVAELMGHSSLDMVATVYVHLAGEAPLPEGGGRDNQRGPATPESSRAGSDSERSPGRLLANDSSTQSRGVVSAWQPVFSPDDTSTSPPASDRHP